MATNQDQQIFKWNLIDIYPSQLPCKIRINILEECSFHLNIDKKFI